MPALLSPELTPPRTEGSPAGAKRIHALAPVSRRQWLVPLGIALGIECLLFGLGFFSPRDTLLDLIAGGEVQAVQAAEPKPFEQEVELENPTPAPPPVADPEFIKPVDPVETPIAPPEPPEPIRDETPPPETPPSPPQPDPAPMAEAASAPAAPATPVADADTADSPVPLAPSPVVVLGNKDFPKPPYPYEARLQHMEGTVSVQLDVVDGQLTGAEVAASSGHALLDRSALAWIRQHWRFPADVTRTLVQPISFQLGG